MLQEGQFERVGEERTRHVDVRVIAATNRDLKALTRRGRFREDLYFRLNVFPIDLVPLRERAGRHRPLLAMHLLDRRAPAQDRRVASDRGRCAAPRAVSVARQRARIAERDRARRDPARNGRVRDRSAGGAAGAERRARADRQDTDGR